MSNSIFNIFVNLQLQERIVPDSFSVAALPFSKNHKIGISPEGFPMFFVSSHSKSDTVDINLELISVLFNRNCRVCENDSFADDIYTVIMLKTDNPDLQQYFIDIICIIFQQLEPIPTHKALRIEIEKLIDLFSSISKTPKKTIQGLWAELLIIEQALNPEELIHAWHSSPEDKFDFNNGQDKIEVKSTMQAKRIHTFALEQLNPNPSSRLLIASVFVVQTGSGKSILDLRDSIFVRVIDLTLQLRLNDLILRTMGSDFDRVIDIYFDYQLAIDTLAYFDINDVPIIDNYQIPKEISNVHFSCDLTDIPTVHDKQFDIESSSLFKSLLI